MPRLLLTALFLAGTAATPLLSAQDDMPCQTLTPGPDDALIASPANHTVLYENADVRVLDVHSAPHTRETVHTHRLPSVMYILSRGAGTYDTPDGSDHRDRPADPNFKPLVIAIKSEGPHWTENTGDVPYHAIRVEFKHPGCGLPGWKPAAPDKDDALVAAPTFHTLLFENADVRVLDVHDTPHAKEPWHTHPWPGFFYIVQGTPTTEYKPGQPPVVHQHAPPFKILPIGAETLHAVENTGDVETHFIRFELKYGSTSRPAGPPN